LFYNKTNITKPLRTDNRMSFTKHISNKGQHQTKNVRNTWVLASTVMWGPHGFDLGYLTGTQTVLLLVSM